MTLLLAQGLDLIEIAKALGSLGPAAILALGVIALWRKLEAEREAADKRLQAAQDKLDSFQDARIRELSDLLKGLGGR